jgi:hypothetical protein
MASQQPQLVESSFASEQGHFYTKEGKPAYEIIGANGKQRATTLRDAKKLGLLPSVTTITKMEAAPGLERWKIQQACLACMTLPRLEGESDDAFMARALTDSQEQAKKAASRGAYLHGLLEQCIQGSVTLAEEDSVIVTPVLEWIRVNFGGYKLHAEHSFAHASGFGGKTDLLAEGDGGFGVLIDFKFKDGVDPAETKGYPEHITQLSAYANGTGFPEARCINLFIDSRRPGIIVPREWTAEERETGWAAFKCLLRLHQLRKGL